MEEAPETGKESSPFCTWQWNEIVPFQFTQD
jgi:hypothetical protein